MLNCNEVKDYVSSYFDNELDNNIKNLIDEHLNSCDDCKTYYDEIKNVINECGQIKDEELPDDFKEKLRERLLKEVEKDKTKIKNRSLRNKYIAVFSSIAAGLVLIVLLRGVYNNFYSKSHYSLNDNGTITHSTGTDNSGKNKVSSASNNKESTKLNNNEKEIATDATKDDNKQNDIQAKADAASINDKNSSSSDVQNENTEKIVGNSGKNPSQSQADSAQLATILQENGVDISDGEVTITQTYTNPENQKDRVLDAKLTIYSNDPEGASKKVQELMQKYGGMFDSEDKVGNVGVLYENNNKVLNILIPAGETFENFWSDLKNTFGEGNYGDEGRTEVEKEEDGMQDARALLNIQLENSQSEEEKEMIRSQLNKLDLLDSYTCVKITIQKR